MAKEKRDLRSYDWIVINTSAGKDSQTMMDFVCDLAESQGVLDRVVAVHADLGKVEWEGTKDLAAEQAAHYGIRFEIVERTQDDMLEYATSRNKWPGYNARWCTSEFKRAPVAKLFTRLAKELRDQGIDRQARILNCMGMRAQESKAREKLAPFKEDKRNTNSRRHVDVWLPIHSWLIQEVWDTIKESGVRYHKAYDLGMPRLSCCFCIYAPFEALVVAGHYNQELLREYVEVEKQIGHTFKIDESLADVLAKVEEDIENNVKPEAVLCSWGDY